MKNSWVKCDGYIVIFANGGGLRHEILVDEADFEIVSAFSGTWYARKDRNTFYAWINDRGADGKWKIVKMHRLLLDPPADRQVDHKYHNGLDNRRDNIHIVTNGENARNQINNVEFQSDVDGVTWRTRHNKWQARWNGQALGDWNFEKEAIKAVREYRENGKTPDCVKKHNPAVRQSKERGVAWDSKNGKWLARWKKQYLGYWVFEEDAIKAVREYRATGKIPEHIRRCKPLDLNCSTHAAKLEVVGINI